MQLPRLALTLTVALLGAFLFDFLHIPMPWLLGPLFFILFARLVTPLPIQWPKHMKDIGLVLAGYSIGVAFQLDAFANMGRFFPLMIGSNVFYIILFVVMSRWIARRTKVDQLAALTSTVPGGMSQIVAYAAEKGSQHMTMITFYQVLRVLCILSIVPLIVTSQSTTPPINTATYTPTLFMLLLASYGAGYLAQRVHIPTGYMLGPVILIIAVQLLPITIAVPHLPASALHIAQLFIGMFIGMLLKREDLHLSKKVIFYAFVSAGIYIASAYGLAILVADWYDIQFKTAFLSIMPGGLDQMSLIAASVHADVTLVTAFQLFRVLVVVLIVVPGLKYFTK